MNRRAAGVRGRCAKIVATLGPGSSAPGTIRLLAEAGVDVFRLNFSHGEQEKHKQTYDFIRQTEDLLGRPLAEAGLELFDGEAFFDLELQHFGAEHLAYGSEAADGDLHAGIMARGGRSRHPAVFAARRTSA